MQALFFEKFDMEHILKIVANAVDLQQHIANSGNDV